MKNKVKQIIPSILAVLFAICGVVAAGFLIHGLARDKSTENIQSELQKIKEAAQTTDSAEPEKTDDAEPDGAADATEPGGLDSAADSTESGMLPGYRELYEKNQDLIGWLSIDDTNIDYPVMQTMEDECYYLRRDFYGKKNRNGCLIMDTDSVVGTGTAADGYADGTAPSTNLIIHGHTMKSGEMFGKLPLYADETYGKEHNIIRFDSLYEEREYELIAVFYSQIFYTYEDVFKYYNFFQADTQEEFDDWYDNIKEMSLYDTGVTAEFGDEFITLSCCSYHVEDGRFVVVGRRINSPQYQE